jgi:hypothetical protein
MLPDASRRIGVYGAPPSSPKYAAQDSCATLPLDEAARGESARIDDVHNAVPRSYLRERRAPIADPELNLSIIHDALENLKSEGWDPERQPELADSELQPVLVSEELFQRVRQAPLSLISLPPPPALATSTNPPVPRLSHSQLFAAAVSDSPRSARFRGTMTGRGDAKAAVTDRKGRKEGPREQRPPPPSLPPPPAYAGHQPRPDDTPTVTLSHFDFRLQTTPFPPPPPPPPSVGLCLCTCTFCAN